MKYILIKLTNGEWIKIKSKDIDTVCEAESPQKGAFIIKRQLYSGTENNTATDVIKK